MGYDNFLNPVNCSFSDICSYYKKRCSNCVRNKSLKLNDNYKAKGYDYMTEPPKCGCCGNLNVIKGYKCNNCGEIV